MNGMTGRAPAPQRGAKTGAVLLSEIFPSYHLSRVEGRPPVDPIPYEFEICLKFLQPSE